MSARENLTTRGIINNHNLRHENETNRNSSQFLKTTSGGKEFYQLEI